MSKVLSMSGKLVTLFLMLGSGWVLSGQTVNIPRNDSDSAWQKISSYFNPPAEFREVYGDYRSPLKFYNGQQVTNAEEWKNRRGGNSFTLA